METIKQSNEHVAVNVCLTGSPAPTEHHKVGDWFFVTPLKVASYSKKGLCSQLDADQYLYVFIFK